MSDDERGNTSRGSPITSQPSPTKNKGQSAPIFAMPPPSYNESAALNQGEVPVYTPGNVNWGHLVFP